MKGFNFSMRKQFAFALFFTLIAGRLFGQGIELKLRFYLEGPLLYNHYETGQTHDRPLMRDDLRDDPFTGKRLIPVQDVYQTPVVISPTLTIDLTGSFTHVLCGGLPQFKSIPNPNAVFAVTGENAIVDWIFVELRDADDPTVTVATRSGLLQRDGDVVDLDGQSPLSFVGVERVPYYVVVRHRNHFGAMTKYPISVDVMETLLDMSSYDVPLYDKGSVGGYDFSNLAMKSIYLLGKEVRALWAGDFNHDGLIQFVGQDNDEVTLQNEVSMYDETKNPNHKFEFDGAIGYLNSDFDLNGKAKIKGPNDEFNSLYAQILFYPLNAYYIDNFNFIIEQLP